MPIIKDASSTTEDIVFDAAIRLMAERGYHGTSLRDVARDVDMQMSSLYHYFPSKQALLVNIMRHSLLQLTSRVESAIQGIEGPLDRLTVATNAHIGYHIENPEAAIVADSELRSLEGDHRREVVSLRDNYEGIFVQILIEGVSDGSFSVTEPGIATTALLVACGSVSSWYVPSKRLGPEQMARVLLDLFLDGMKS